MVDVREILLERVTLTVNRNHQVGDVDFESSHIEDHNGRKVCRILKVVPEA